MSGYCFKNRLGLLVLSILMLCLFSCTSELEEKLQKNLFTPYFNFLAYGKNRQAYDEFTSPYYQKKQGFEKFSRHYENVREAFGQIVEGRVLETNKTYEISTKRSYVSVNCKIFFKDRFVLVRYEVAEINGQYKLDDSHLSSIVDYDGPW